MSLRLLGPVGRRKDNPLKPLGSPSQQAKSGMLMRNLSSTNAWRSNRYVNMYSGPHTHIEGLDVSKCVNSTVQTIHIDRHSTSMAGINHIQWQPTNIAMRMLSLLLPQLQYVDLFMAWKYSTKITTPRRIAMRPCYNAGIMYVAAR